MFILGWEHRTQFETIAVVRVGGLVNGCMGGLDMIRIMPLRGSILQYIELARLSARLKIQDGAECGNINGCNSIWLTMLGAKGKFLPGSLVHK